MAKFMLFLLSNGTAPGALLPIVPADTFDTMFKPWNRIQSPGVEDYFSKAEGTPVSRTHTGIALGLKTGQYRGTDIVIFVSVYGLFVYLIFFCLFIANFVKSKVIFSSSFLIL